MLKFFAPRLPHRTAVSSLDELWLDNGRSRVLLRNAFADGETGRFLVLNQLPPAPQQPLDMESPNSSLCPPFHIHLREDEIFRVISGSAKFMLLDQKQATSLPETQSSTDGITRRIITKDQVITIPRGQIHTFRNASSEHSLILEFGFSSPGHNAANDALNMKMRQFFLNTQLYRSDCSTQGVPRALSQVLLFNRSADVALVPSWLLHTHQRFPSTRSFIERYFASILGRALNLFGGILFGRCLLGMRSSYEEYCPSKRVKSEAKDRMTSADATGAKQRQSDVPKWACQAWRDHSFDGQDESWRK